MNNGKQMTPSQQLLSTIATKLTAAEQMERLSGEIKGLCEKYPEAKEIAFQFGKTTTGECVSIYIHRGEHPHRSGGHFIDGKQTNIQQEVPRAETDEEREERELGEEIDKAKAKRRAGKKGSSKQKANS